MSEDRAETSTLSGKAAEDQLPSENPLSEREMEVSRLLVTGASNAEIARELVISPHTVKVHLRNVFEKLQVNSRTEATMVLLQRGWLTVPGVEVAAAPAAEPSPDPQPLPNLPPQVQPWQQVYLLVVAGVCLLALLLPALRRSPQTSFGLLSDAQRTLLGKPPVAMHPRWEARTPLPQARSRLGLALLGNRMFAVGGENPDHRATDAVELYDLAVNEWRAMRPLPEPLANVAAVAWADDVYVAGGSTIAEDGNTAIRDRLWRYAPEVDEWQDAGKLPGPLAGAVLAADEQALYLVGGWDGKQARTEVWRYVPSAVDLADGSWQLVTHMSTPRAFLGAAIAEGKLYVLGGDDGQSELDSAAAYDLASDEWTALPPMSSPRSGLSAVFDGLAVFALGGGGPRAVDTHERFDPATSQWSNFPSPIQGEWRHLASVSYDDRLYLLGGWSGDYLDTHLTYQSTFRAMLPIIIRGD